MNWMKWLAVFGVLMAFAGQAQARASVPLLNFENQMIVRADGKALTLEEVRKGIARAAMKRKWTVQSTGENTFRATYLIRSHVAIVDIAYTTDRFSVKYNDSDNLHYAKVDTPQVGQGGQIINHGQEMIHPNYNVWVRQLVEEIQLELQF